MWYFDATGFCLSPSVPYAWQPIGQTIEVPVSSHRQRLNVVGFFNRHNDLVPHMIEGSVDTSMVVECFDQFSQNLNTRAYVWIDNAPMHRSQVFINQIAKWVKRGLIVKYLPPYSPQLNLIEILWRFMKYHWLPLSAYSSFSCLVTAVEKLLVGIGTEYTIRFQNT